ncbi:MAG: peptidoglycan-binding protein [Pseudomonadota bacterium]
MNYVGMRIGQSMPAIGIAQKLLNRSGARLVVDGAFGGKTKRAVRIFQLAHGLHPDGVIGKQTWPLLVSGLRLPIGDIVDMWNYHEPQEVLTDTFNSDKLPFTAMQPRSVGVEGIVGDMVREYRGAGLFLLRLHGHGAPGRMMISGGWYSESPLTESAFNDPGVSAALRRFSEIMSPIGSISINGCSVARGRAGNRMIQTLATMTGFPVVAPVKAQWGGYSTTYFMEGPVRTAFPNPRMTLRDWCDELPELPPLNASPHGLGAPTGYERVLQSMPAF